VRPVHPYARVGTPLALTLIAVARSKRHFDSDRKIGTAAELQEN